MYTLQVVYHSQTGILWHHMKEITHTVLTTM